MEVTACQSEVLFDLGADLSSLIVPVATVWVHTTTPPSAEQHHEDAAEIAEEVLAYQEEECLLVKVVGVGPSID